MQNNVVEIKKKESLEDELNKIKSGNSQEFSKLEELLKIEKKNSEIKKKNMQST